MILGVIGDDFTGSSDIANTLAKAGMRVTQYTGIPNEPADQTVEAGVVSLKSRTIPVDQAVEQSMTAAKWLLDQGCDQIFFKYCSTFDSTPKGNIGPVAEALSEFLDEEKVIFCPAFPDNGRSVYQGNLFVGDRLLHESGMKDHPLTPMTDPDLRRWLALQTQIPVHHLAYETVRNGVDEIRSFLERGEPGFYIADAIEDQHLIECGYALKGRRFITGGSGLAMGLPANFGISAQDRFQKTSWRGFSGPAVILSGSCSVATREQVRSFRKQGPSLELAAADIVEHKRSVSQVAEWIFNQNSTPLVYTSADPKVVTLAQEKYGHARVANGIEQFFGELACHLVDQGFQRIIAAGGETSGAVVTALGIKSMVIGPEIAPGVPALRDGSRDLVIALKSGNFGDVNFFEEALEVLAA